MEEPHNCIRPEELSSKGLLLPGAKSLLEHNKRANDHLSETVNRRSASLWPQSGEVHRQKRENQLQVYFCQQPGSLRHFTESGRDSPLTMALTFKLSVSKTLFSHADHLPLKTYTKRIKWVVVVGGKGPRVPSCMASSNDSHCGMCVETWVLELDYPWNFL